MELSGKEFNLLLDDYLVRGRVCITPFCEGIGNPNFAHQLSNVKIFCLKVKIDAAEVPRRLTVYLEHTIIQPGNQFAGPNPRECSTTPIEVA